MAENKDSQAAFMEAVGSIKEYAKVNGNIVTREDVHSFFKDMALDDAKFQMISGYLMANGIKIQGEDSVDNEFLKLMESASDDNIDESGQHISKEEQEDKKVADDIVSHLDYEEDEKYLKIYLQDISGIQPMTDVTRSYLLMNIVEDNDKESLKLLTESYLEKIASWIEPFRGKGVLACDLVQEANLAMTAYIGQQEWLNNYEWKDKIKEGGQEDLLNVLKGIDEAVKELIEGSLNMLIDEQTDDNPFFLYLAYNAPHWPLHAKDKDLEKFAGKYDKGWEAVREERYRKMVELGIVNPDWKLAEWESRAWNELTEAERDSSSLRMSVYAAQVYCMDYNIGKLIDYLEEEGKLDNTLILFLSDNGACAEPYSEKGFGSTSEINKLDSWVHPSYGLPWAQVSNTPYRKYKVRAYEGGIATPLIISWPEVLGKYSNQIRRNVGFVPDIMATFVEVARAEYPTTYHDGNSIIPMAGTSLMSTVHNPDKQIHEYIFGEHFNNCFVRWKNWKAVKDEKMKEWELYDIEKDRTEWNNVAAEYPDVLKKMVRKWEEWANECYIFPKRLN